jgi:hypothetical protein
MADKTCFIHVGTVKTGSSALQYALAHDRDTLLTKGYAYPDRPSRLIRTKAGEPTGGNASGILRALRAADAKAVTDATTELASGDNNLVLSNEGLFRFGSQQLDTLCRALRANGYSKLKCLVVFRPQTELLLSAYLQNIKSNAPSIWKGLEPFIDKWTRQDRTNWYLCAQKLESSFGAGNLTVRWLPDVRRNEGIIRACYDWLGLPETTVQVPTINLTPGQEAAAVLKRVNAAALGNRKFADAFLSTAQQLGLVGTKMTLGTGLARQIFDATYKSNVQMLRHYCPHLSPSDELKRPEPEVERFFDQATFQAMVHLASKMLIENGADKSQVRQAFSTPGIETFNAR